jgi:hypothetical protein
MNTNECWQRLTLNTMSATFSKNQPKQIFPDVLLAQCVPMERTISAQLSLPTRRSDGTQKRILIYLYLQNGMAPAKTSLVSGLLYTTPAWPSIRRRGRRMVGGSGINQGGLTANASLNFQTLSLRLRSH